MVIRNRLMIFLTTILICSCAYTPINVPDIKPCPLVKPVSCPKLDMPEPIPKNLKIVIKNGYVEDFDDNGSMFIRQYAATRKAIKQFNEVNR